MPSAPGGLVNYALRVAVAIAAVSIAAVVVVIDPQAAHLLGQVLRRCVLVVLDIPLEKIRAPIGVSVHAVATVITARLVTGKDRPALLLHVPRGLLVGHFAMVDHMARVSVIDHMVVTRIDGRPPDPRHVEIPAIGKIPLDLEPLRPGRTGPVKREWPRASLIPGKRARSDSEVWNWIWPGSVTLPYSSNRVGEATVLMGRLRAGELVALFGPAIYR